MMTSPSVARRLAVFCLLIAGTAVAKNTDPSPVPPHPQRNQLSLIGMEPTAFTADGNVTWIANDFDRKTKIDDPRCGGYPVVQRRWNPATGATGETPLGIGIDGLVAQLATPAGIYFVSSRTGLNCIALVPPIGKVVTAMLTRRFAGPRLELLSDGSIAVVERDATTGHIRVDLVRRRTATQIEAEAMPALAIRYRDDFQQAALPGGRLMVLGGSDAQYRGCNPCRAETHILDPKTKTWSAGPSMLEARSEHLATRLPDGSILVTGGWTPNHGWGHGPSRSAERWNPATDRFEAAAPMPSGSARHRAVWMPGEVGKTLLIGGGNNASIEAYDVRTGQWRTAGASRQGAEEGRCRFVPFMLAGNAYAWSGCGWEFWEVIALHFARAPASPPPEKFLVNYRGGATFLPSVGGQPAIVIGGSIHAGMNSYLATSAVEAVDTSGAVRALPSLNEARHGAVALRVGEGVLVMGGRGEDSDKTAREYGGPLLTSAEWLASSTPDSTARWVRLDRGVRLPRSYESLPDGSLLGFEDGGIVIRYTLSRGNDSAPILTADASGYPPLNRERQSVGGAGDHGSTAVKIRALADGRVVVAGGHVRAEKIALYSEDSNQPDARDEYEGIGPFLPSRRHEIYDPAAKRWRTTAPSRGAGGKVAILPDGRVLKIGQLPGKGSDPGPYVLEVSNPEGTAWNDWPANSRPKMKLSDITHPLVVDGELFLAGELGSLSTGGGPSGLEWFNAASGRWETLWWADPYDNWRDHAGRVIVRTLANGKKVILPVHGY